MPRLFYKDMRQHETAYRHERADEATNDLMLGAKVSAYTGFETAKEKSIDEIATNYGKFLKALKTKEIPLLGTNMKIASEVKKTAEEIAKEQDSSLDSMSTTNMLMPHSSQAKTISSTGPSETTIKALQAQGTPEIKAIRDASAIVGHSKNVANALSQVRSILKPVGLDKNYENILHTMGYRASTGKKRRGAKAEYQPLNIDALTDGLNALMQGYFQPNKT